MAAYVNVRYFLFHYWNKAQIFMLNASPELVKREDVPADYLLRQEKMPKDSYYWSTTQM